MNANVSIYQDSVKDSSGILTSESNEIGSLKIIMPDKLNQLTARSSYICHIDDFVKGNKDYYGFDTEVSRRLLIGVGELPFFSGSVPDHQDSIVYDLFFLIFSSSIFITIIISSFVLIIPTSYSNQHILYP